MMKHFKYLRYLLRHKWYVMIECFKAGLYWRGIVHDMSKFTPTEWFPYVETFYGEKPSPRDKTGAYNPLAVSDEFDRAWLSHQHNNPHHWQYWILRGDKDTQKVLPMPEQYRIEMLCDWRGAGRAIKGKDETKEWYLANRGKMLIHFKTKDWIEQMLGLNVEANWRKAKEGGRDDS